MVKLCVVGRTVGVGAVYFAMLAIFKNVWRWLYVEVSVSNEYGSKITQFSGTLTE